MGPLLFIGYRQRGEHGGQGEGRRKTRFSVDKRMSNGLGDAAVPRGVQQ